MAKYFLVINKDNETVSVYPNGNYEKDRILRESDNIEELQVLCVNPEFLMVVKLLQYARKLSTTKYHIQGNIEIILKRWFRKTC